MGWSRVSDTSQVVAPGEAVTVKVLRVDDDMQKIALGLKQLSDDPWLAVPAKYAVGQTYPGRVARLADFGVFVELEPGVTGLIPVNEADVPNDAALAEEFPVGADVEVSVLDVDASGRRMRLSRRAVRNAQETVELREYTERQGDADREGFGSLADKLRGALKPR
jgi:ribosomal protein S1